MTRNMKAFLLSAILALPVQLCSASPTPVWLGEADSNLLPERQAIVSGNLQMITEFIQNGGDINQKDVPPYSSLLSLALLFGQWEIAHYLLKKGANPREECGYIKPLEQALLTIRCSENHEQRNLRRDVVHTLIAAGADIPPSLSGDLRELLSELLQSEGGRWLPQLLQKLVQADSSIDEAWLRSSRFLHTFVTLGKAERSTFIERILQKKEMPDDLIRLISSFWQE